MILMLGIAGSGKSTQSQLLTATGKYRWVYVGEVLRRNTVGKDAADMLQGKLLDDDTVIQYVADEITRIGEGPEIIIDGFPRSAYQAQWLVGQHADNSYTLTAVIHIDVDKEVVIERLEHRGRPDDTKEAIAARFYEYDKGIYPIIEELTKHKVPIITVNGNQDAIDVYSEIVKKLQEL